jgi:hypothetical protein
MGGRVVEAGAQLPGSSRARCANDRSAVDEEEKAKVEEEEEEEEDVEVDEVGWTWGVAEKATESEVGHCSNVTEYVRLSCALITEAGESRPAAWMKPNGEGEVCETGNEASADGEGVPGRRAAAVSA